MANTKDEVFSSAEVRNLFGKETAKKVSPTSADPSYKPEDFKGALLTEERVIVYTTAEKRTGKNGNEFYVFNNPFTRTMVFPASSVLETDIDGLISEKEMPVDDNG